MTGGLLHSLTGGRSRPIEIQRRLKLRDLQNRAAMPRVVAAALAKAITAGVRPDTVEAPPSCLLVTGRRPFAQN